MRFEDLSDITLNRIFLRIRHETPHREIPGEFWVWGPELAVELVDRLVYLWWEVDEKEGRIKKKDRPYVLRFLREFGHRWPWIQRLLDEKPIPTEGYRIVVQGRNWDVSNRLLKAELAKVKDEPGEVYSYKTGVVLPINEAWELVSKK